MAPTGTVASTLIACFFLLISASFLPHAEALIDCEQLGNEIKNCFPYLLGKAPAPTPICCSAMQALNKVVDTSENRMEACKCIRDAAGKTPAFRPDRVSRINTICKVKIPSDIFINSSCTDIQ